MRELLLEIGCEEIPARFLPGAIETMRQVSAGHLESAGIPFSGLCVYATPRRITLLAQGLPEMQKDRVKEVFGPPKKVAFDENGNPTKAAQGFAKTAGVSLDKLVVKEKGAGQYLAAVIEEKGKPLREVLPETLKSIVLSFNFPKSMRWGDGDLRFVRPIRWLTALFGFEVMEFEIDGIKSGNITRGHRFLSPVAFQIREASVYKKVLETSFVIADQEKRRQMIAGDLERLSNSVCGKPVMDDDLLRTVLYLVEYPVGILCDFSRQYLELPEELLITVMKDHQKYFALREEKSGGKLLNYFVVISNTLKENSFVVRTGAERVIKARFEDARFYYGEDLKKPLESRLEGLKKVLFHERMGTLYDKTERVKKLAGAVSEAVFREHAGQIARAALLSKTDLVSGVVREFPELQGVMGKYYALRGGEPPQVADAIYEQYLPRNPGGELPKTPAGTALSLSDRMDNIASFFSIGLAPTGSEDPFALRRQAIGIVSTLAESGLALSIAWLAGEALKGVFPFSFPALPEAGRDTEAGIIKFFESRLPQIFEQKGLTEQDVMEALIAGAAYIPLKDSMERFRAVSRFKKDPRYPEFIAAIKRVKNILSEKDKVSEFSEKLLLEEKEKELHREFIEAEKKFDPLYREGAYDGALLELLALPGPINGFFDGVLVMDKDSRVRENRLALLRKIWLSVSRIADFSKLSEV